MNESVIRQLMLASKEASKEVEAEQEKLDHIVATIEKRKNTYRKNSLEKAESRLQEVLEEERKKSQKTIQEVHQKYQRLIDALDKTYEQQHERWEKELLERCM